VNKNNFRLLLLLQKKKILQADYKLGSQHFVVEYEMKASFRSDDSDHFGPFWKVDVKGIANLTESNFGNVVDAEAL
jgi:hypothetical protein